MPTATEQDYLKAIYQLEGSFGQATTSQLAERLGVAMPSVTGMLRKLAKARLARHHRYRGVTLTSNGRRAALVVLRRHRLLETYLAEKLGVPWDLVHREADRLEHAISPYLEARLDEALGFPTVDPHGSPIPTADGRIAVTDGATLVDLEEGCRGTVREVPDGDPELLRHLAGLGIRPGVTVEVLSRAPFDGPLELVVGGKECHLGPSLAKRICIDETSDR